MTKDDALKLALEALEFDSFYGTNKQEAITAIKEALEQPEQEPVAKLLLQSKQNYVRNFGPSATADWIYSDLLELLNAPPKPTAQNFCSRCGKRTPDLTTIHTCTPPRGLEMT